MKHVGTAGWSIASRYQETFPGSGSQLERYAQRLNAVEINSSFHRHHRVQTYARWSACVPAHFRFSVKVPRTLTHAGGLTPVADVLDRFLQEIRGLGDKLGVLLVQLPPSLPFDEPVVSHFFRVLSKRIDVKLALEPRHPSWGSRQADSVLGELAVARVAADPAPWPGANEPGGSREIVYFRWHGQPRKYYSDYDEEQLGYLREQMAAASGHAPRVWTIFDNTVLGCALGNALAVATTEPRY